jgi:adenylate cyclase
MKNIKKLFSHLGSPFTIGTLVTLIVTWASLDYYANRHNISGKSDGSIAGLIQEIHEKTIDWRLNDRGLRPPHERVAILAIDDDSIELEGRWPWSRTKIAKLIDRTLMYGTKHIAFDIIFSEADSTSIQPLLDRLGRASNPDPKSKAFLAPLLQAEAQEADSDRILANSIQARSDALVMGAFYLGELETPAHSELCLDGLFERSYPSRYWSKELNPITVIDSPLNKFNFPRAPLKEHLAAYFVALEASRARQWLDTHPKVTERLRKDLQQTDAAIDPEFIPGLISIVLNNDYDTGKALLGEIDPAYQDIERLREFYGRFVDGFEKRELAEIRKVIRQAGFDYCERFLSPADELLNENNYLKTWGDSPETRQEFAELSWQTFWSRLQTLAAQKQSLSLEEAIANFKSNLMPNAIPQIEQWTVNIPLLLDATSHTGYFNAAQDLDGNIRRTRLLVRHGNSYATSLALKTFLVDKGYSSVVKIDLENVGRSDAQSRQLRSLEINDADGNTVMMIPADSTGKLMINYSGPRFMIPHVSATQLLNDKPWMTVIWRHRDAKTGEWIEDYNYKVNKKEFLRDKILIAGATAVGVYDLRVTPFDENFPGVETHANVLSNLLTEEARTKGQKISNEIPGFLRTHPLEERIMWAILLAGGIVLSALLTWFGSLAGLGITIFLFSLVYAFDKYFLFASGIVSTVALPLGLISADFVALTFYKYFTEERTKRELKGTFQKYVSPAIVNEILSDPANIELGGRKMNLTVMFSDVRGFTTISERLDPRALSDLLNSYLTPMTNLVFQHKGTLDKYMGDAIMAFWGAPLKFDDHAKHAARCALEMLKKLAELQAEFRSKGLPEIDIGIGLNTGEMSVGNMGSNTVRSYTVMGDAVNLGSRLEGINKEYGTRIIISEFTQAAIKDAFVSREVDWVKVKGKDLPVRIFELIAEGQAPEEQKESLQHFAEGFDLYHQKRFIEARGAFERALASRPDDSVSQLYVKRCSNYLEEPPPDNWDGVFTMKTK